VASLTGMRRTHLLAGMRCLKEVPCREGKIGVPTRTGSEGAVMEGRWEVVQPAVLSMTQGAGRRYVHVDAGGGGGARK